MTAEFQEQDYLFDVSEDLVQGGMTQVVDIIASKLTDSNVLMDWPVKKLEQVITQDKVIVTNLRDEQK